ncbi:hypothetical protein HDV06_004912 [Boothiomyces sp. JEL0866]|nr:hypothetical protein HDV06_004912 [Boothiomyces sp. JEL0866]
MNIDKLDGSLVPFDTDNEVIISVVHTIVAIVGLIGGVTAFVPTFFSRNTPSSLLLLSLCWADLTVCLCCTILGIRDLMDGGWSTGISGCIIDSILIDAGCFASVFSIFAITWERYNSVIKRTTLTFSTVYLWISGVWILTFLIALFPFYTLSYGYSISLQPGKIVCVITWWDRHPGTIAIVTICAVMLILTIMFILYAYFSIVREFMKTNPLNRTATTLPPSTYNHEARPTDLRPNTDVSSKTLPNPKHDAEKILLFKSVIICSTYIACWTPYMILIIYSIVLEQPVSPTYDAFCNISLN